MSKNKPRGFNSQTLNLPKNTTKKVGERSKKMDEEAKTAQLLEIFEQTFQEPNQLERSWIKSGVVNPTTDGLKLESSEAQLYKPSPKFGTKPIKRASDSVKVSPAQEPVKKTLVCKKPVNEKKKSNLELFKEELKVIQEQRQQRHQLRNSRMASSSQSSHPKTNTESTHGYSRQPDMPTSDVSLEIDDTLIHQTLGLSKKGTLDKPRDMDYPYDYDVDRTTTNLFLGNLCPQMTEQQLCDVFGRYGPLASVKIMWPRTEEQRAVSRNCGFVAFMNRVDSERALENLRGKELMGYEMKLGWGKTVPLPAYPVYVPPPLLELIKPPPQSGLPFNAQPLDWLKSVRTSLKERAKLITDAAIESSSDSPAPSIPPAVDRSPYNMHQMTKDNIDKLIPETVVKVIIPPDRILLALIHRFIEFVVREGPQFEAAIMHRELKNPQFKFLFDYQTPEHLYYRWKLWSILHGELLTTWKTEDFRMYESGSLWRPPVINPFVNGMPETLVEEDDYPYASTYVPQARQNMEELMANLVDKREPETVPISLPRRTGLTEAQQSRLTGWINNLEPCKSKIGEVMFWCLEHADSATNIVDLIADSLKLPDLTTNKTDNSKPVAEPVTGSSTAEKDSFRRRDQPVKTLRNPTTVQALLARLYLTSDILYNSCAKVPNASFFRKCFELRLPDIFKNISNFYRELESKLKAEQLKQKILICFRAWEDWAVYSNEFLIQLQNIFLGLSNENQTDEFDEEQLAGIPLDSVNVSGMTAIDSNVESIDGAPLVQYDGDPLDVDGSPLVSDGNDDYEGTPLNTNQQSPLLKPHTQPIVDNVPSTAPLFVPSKWESIDGSLGFKNSTSNQRESFSEKIMPKTSNSDIDEDVDGKPLDEFGAVGLGLVAYDDDDAISSSSQTSPISTNAVTEKVSKIQPSSIITESRRAKLREIEVKVMKYQDNLESSRKSGESSVSDDAIAEQVQRYRERLLDRLDDVGTIKPTSSQKKTKSVSMSNINKTTPSSSKRYRQKVQRDRSPPRSFRDREPRQRRRSDSSPALSNADSDEEVSPSNHSSTCTTSQPEHSRKRQRSVNCLTSEEIEEGEASDEDIYVSQTPSHKRTRHRHTNNEARGNLFGQKSSNKSPGANSTRHSRRSRTPSPNRRRSVAASSSTSLAHRPSYSRI